MKDFELSIEQKKREIIEDRLNNIRDEGHTGEVSILIKYLGRGKDTGKDFFSIADNYSGMDNEFFYEYLDELKELPLIRNEITDGKVIRSNNIQETPEETKEIEDAIQDIERCIEDRYKEMKAIAKQLGIDEKDINSISEIDLEQKIEDKELEKQEEKEQDENESKQITEEEVKKVGMTGMNEINLNSKIDDKGTELGEVLKLDGYTKLLVVHSYKLTEITDANGKKGKNSINKFSLIAQKADGTFETIPKDKLEPDIGTNSEITEANNKDNVEVKKEDCRYRVPGTNKSLIINQDGPYGITNVYFSQNTRDNDGQFAQKIQDKYDGTDRKDVEVLNLFNNFKGINQTKDSVEEVRDHQKAGCEEIDIDEADGREDTGHVHFDPQSFEQQKAIEQIMKEGNVQEETAKGLLRTYLESKDNQKEGQERIEKAKDMAVEEINKQAIGDRGGRRDN